MRLKKTFPGGIHPREGGDAKVLTGALPSVAINAPASVGILLSQSVGAPCESMVKPGERVLMGQKIGQPAGYVGAPVHASVSGKVKGIQQRVNASGALVPAIVIENDGLDQWHPDIQPVSDPLSLDKKTLLSLIREAGIVGLGGAAFPTAVKLSPPEDKKIDYLILNGAECEPFLTSDHRAMLEHSGDIADGLLIAQRTLGAEHAILAIEDNKPDAIDVMRRAIEGSGASIRVLETRYPQGGEKQLIQAATGREVPSGKLPMDAGCVVMNVSTAAAISVALRTGKPIVDRIVTVTGAVNNPQNLLARVGTPIGFLIEACGGMKPGANKIVLGGPMMGLSAYDLETPVVKATSGILVMIEPKSFAEKTTNCIRCASCVAGCPVGLTPLWLHQYSSRALFEEAKANHALDCIECGICSYVCPAKLPLTQSIRVAKREIMARQKK